MTVRLPPLLLALAAALSIAAAPDPAPSPAPLRLVETLSPQGLQEVSPGAIVSTAVIAKPDSAILASDVSLDHSGDKRKFARGEVIHAEGDTGVAGVPRDVFCEDAHDDPAGKTPTAQRALGLLGARLPTRVDKRFCLFDADKDGKFDHGLLLGAKGDGRAPFAISPVEYGVIEGRRLSEDSVARLRYVGPVESPSSIAFDLEAYANGMMHTVPARRTFIPVGKLPAYAIIGVAVVTVLTYDAKTRVATIRMDHDLAPGHIVLPDLANAH